MGKVPTDKSVEPGSEPLWITRFPRLRGLDDATAKHLMTASHLLALSAGSLVFQQGDPCLNYILLLRGSVRVGLIDLHGHEMTLYRLEPKAGCILTTASLLASRAYSAFAIAETDVEAVLVPKAVFMQILHQSSVFRAMVFTDHSERLLDLMGVVGHLAFQSIDYRLAEKLQNLAGTEGILRLTHDALGVELGTAREVVSRRLKHFEQNGWVSLQRGKITLLPKFFSDRRAPPGIAVSSKEA